MKLEGGSHKKPYSYATGSGGGLLPFGPPGVILPQHLVGQHVARGQQGTLAPSSVATARVDARVSRV